jgi:hypothetical protein
MVRLASGRTTTTMHGQQLTETSNQHHLINTTRTDGRQHIGQHTKNIQNDEPDIRLANQRLQKSQQWPGIFMSP